MKSTNEIIQFLKQILNERTLDKAELIKAFQDEVWNDENLKDTTLNEILSELAYDLDFYEQKEEWRKESPNFYGIDRLNEIVKSGIVKLEEYERGCLISESGTVQNFV
jgi:hypothetical protein